jgi:hypothetical protein
MEDKYDEVGNITEEMWESLSKRPQSGPRIIVLPTPLHDDYQWLKRMFIEPNKRVDYGENKMRAVLTPDDLKRGDLIDTTWHPVEITDYTEKEAGTDKSTNCYFHFKVIDGPAKGSVLQKMFNEKALGFGKNLWKVLFGPADPVKGYSDGQLTTESFKAQIGKKLKVYVKRGKSDRGNEFNDVADFMPLA